VSLIGIGIGQASFVFGQSLMEVIGQYHLGKARYIFGSHWNHYHRLLSSDECYHHLLTEVIDRYHRSINKTYIWRTFNVID